MKKYLIAAGVPEHLHAHEYRAVVADNITPDVMS